ncbi:MAG: AAA family ATPase [Saprospiraceae bacterium]|nr:AAA family ATPase [Saprospiraceae bacterium]
MVKANHKIEKLQIGNFTCFEVGLFRKFSKGINIFIGENGTGKTHVLKALYAFTNNGNLTPKENTSLNMEGVKYISDYIGASEGINLLHDDTQDGYMIMNMFNSGPAEFKIRRTEGEPFMSLQFPQPTAMKNSLYLPHQEMLSWQRGFINIYSRQENGFDRVYYDLAVALNGAKLKSPYLEEAEAFVSEMKETIQAEVYQDENGRFYFKFYNENLTLEPRVVASGINKLGQLMYLILNGSLTKDTIVFWDEPEANLNPRYISVVAKVLKTLAKAGCQLFIATHDYLLIHLLSLDAEYPQEDNPGIRFFSFFKTPNGTKIEEGDTLADLQHNVILDEYAALHEKELTLFQENLK